MKDYNNTSEGFEKMSRKEFLKWNFGQALKDKNAFFILVSNVILLYFYYSYDWSISIVLTYVFIQSILILFFYNLFYLFVKDDNIAGLKIQTKNSEKVYTKNNLLLRGVLALIFLGFVFLVFMFFALIFSVKISDLQSLVIPVLVLIINQVLINFGKDKSLPSYYATSALSIGQAFLFPVFVVCFSFFLIIPYIGMFIFILIKTLYELIFYNLSKSSHWKKTFLKKIEIVEKNSVINNTKINS